MVALFDKPSHKRWPRAQKFHLLPSGAEAETRYREAIVAARTTGGREAFDAARADWAKTAALQPGDGTFLGELLDGDLTLPELVKAVESSGITRQETHAAIDRLVEAGLLQPLPVSAPPPNRYR